MDTTKLLMRSTIQALRNAGCASIARAMENLASDPTGDRVLYRNEWLELRETDDGYVYTHEAKSDGQGVAVLAYRSGQQVEIVGRYERCPCHHDDFALTSLTGQVEDGEGPRETAVRELQEEAGIYVDQGELAALGTVRPSKQADTTIHLFAVDVGDREIGEAIGDGTPGEAGAYCRWVSVSDAAKSKCPVLSTMILRYIVLSPTVGTPPY